MKRRPLSVAAMVTIPLIAAGCTTRWDTRHLSPHGRLHDSRGACRIRDRQANRVGAVQRGSADGLGAREAPRPEGDDRPSAASVRRRAGLRRLAGCTAIPVLISCP